MLNSHSEAPIEVWLVSASTKQSQNSQPSSMTQAHDPKQPFAGNLFVVQYALCGLVTCCNPRSADFVQISTPRFRLWLRAAVNAWSLRSGCLSLQKAEPQADLLQMGLSAQGSSEYRIMSTTLMPGMSMRRHPAWVLQICFSKPQMKTWT